MYFEIPGGGRMELFDYGPLCTMRGAEIDQEDTFGAAPLLERHRVVQRLVQHHQAQDRDSEDHGAAGKGATRL